jgi:hypothetical protein
MGRRNVVGNLFVSRVVAFLHGDFATAVDKIKHKSRCLSVELSVTDAPAEPRHKVIAEAARDLRKGERWLRDWLKRHPYDQKGEPYYRLAGRTKFVH